MTNAWIQRLLVFGSFLFWWWLAALLWPAYMGWALLCVAMPFLITPVLLVIQFVLLARTSAGDPAPQPSTGALMLAWLREWGVANRVFNHWQPFSHKAIPDNLHPTPGRRGIVLVHGYFCNRALWTWWMRLLRKQYRVFVAVDLEPAYGSISAYARVIEEAVSKLEQATGLPPLIVGHSMGGLAIRTWLAQDPRNAGRIHRAVSLGTPHRGTWLGRLAHSTNGHEMNQGSAWLQQLREREQHGGATPSYNNWVCYYSNCDNIVFPVSNATLAGADNRLITGRGHMELAVMPQVLQECLDLLDT
jgi:triacylglycerol lipase